MALEKQFLKTKPVCKVTFTLPGDLAGGAASVFLVGDFNAWDPAATPMKRGKAGDFSVTLNLDNGREFKYRFLLDGSTWMADVQADRQEYCEYAGGDNSVVVTSDEMAA